MCIRDRPVSGRLPDLETIEAETESLEKQLTRSSADFRASQLSFRVRMDDIRKQLQPEEAAVEFVRFNLCHKNWTDTIFYAADIIRKTDAVPVFIPLCLSLIHI